MKFEFEFVKILVGLIFLISKKNTHAYSQSEMVNITVFYETLCPASRGLITGQIWKAFQTVGPIMNLKLVPYGNAWQMYVKETDSWKFTCQHGNDECWGNLFQACVINQYPRKEDHLPIINCMLSYNINIQDAARLCSTKNNIDTNPIQQCMATSVGNTKMHQMGEMTEKSKIGYTPWVELDNIHTTEIQNRVGNNLVDFVCSNFKGANKPYGCYKFYNF